MSGARVLLDIFTRVTDEEAYSNLALKAGLKQVTDARERRRISAALYTALEHLSYIDYVIAGFARGKLNKTVRNILRIGVCEILFMNRLDSAVCNECVNLAREVGKSALSGYINGVLRSVCRAKESGNLPELPEKIDERLKIETGYPLWLVREYIDRFGEENASKILTASESGISLRAQSPFTGAQLEKYLDDNGIEYKRGDIDPNIYRLKVGFDITENELFLSGAITVQSEGSAAVCRACDVKQCMHVLDACAAPGGKSAYLASLTENNCHITACDLHEHRCELIKKTFSRLNVTCADVKCIDNSCPNNEFPGKFDVVLCDVPCTGLGVLGKPDARYRRDANARESISKLQFAIISACSEYVKVGGTLIYSTCTVSYEENERVTGEFLSKDPRFCLDGGLKEVFPKRAEAESGMIHLLPGIDGTEGFFIARFKRKG